MTDFNNMSPDTFADMFGTGPAQESSKTSGFSFQETDNVDLFEEPEKREEVVEEDKTDEGVTPVNENNLDLDTDILNTGDKKKEVVEEPSKEVSGLSDYFKNRIETGKFVAIEEETADGTKKLFIPSTPEEVDEVIDMQINYQLEQKAQDLEQKFYAGKSPAWQAALQYAENLDSPSELIPFLQGIRNIESVAEIDENEIDGAEQIMRIHGQLTNQDKEIVDTQIDSLKTTNKIIETAQKLKPAILKKETERLTLMRQQEKKRTDDYRNMVVNIRDNAVAAIEQPVANQPLSQEEKASVYELIAYPSEETKGYPIYNKIDELFEKGDFNTLKEVALFLTHKESFLKYLATSASQKTAEGLQRKLRYSEDSRNASSKDVDASKKTIQRNQYNKDSGGFRRL
jgi:hypothetical protein